MTARFPDPLTYDFPEWLPYGKYLYYAPDVVSFGDLLTLENLQEAYTKGIFPWYMDGIPLPWYCPDPRAILDISDLNVPASLKRARNKGLYRFTIDEDFRHVIEECSMAKRQGQKGTWITPAFVERYTELHEAGMAHSVEAWDEAGNLVGGIYGVDAGGVFCGESMFYKRPNASKLALLFLFDHLASRGATWMDIQVMTPHMKTLGAKEIARDEFLDRLATAQSHQIKLF
ncbi:MAG TPA: leucyl/phenylalanyl-tRNA--protein transferase [Pyrinomonadaceae bacterium]|nr:leucyl/phenylalanyl-tRNA--protein transferase [Pyrinomonadaceae bacterium]HMP64694.1 leucyl/phenylalanyl-tRNA--protein transferase [Pyrinomonadaceae bacterium]